jgi:hypothetical protein
LITSADWIETIYIQQLEEKFDTVGISCPPPLSNTEVGTDTLSSALDSKVGRDGEQESKIHPEKEEKAILQLVKQDRQDARVGSSYALLVN